MELVRWYRWNGWTYVFIRHISSGKIFEIKSDKNPKDYTLDQIRTWCINTVTAMLDNQSEELDPIEEALRSATDAQLIAEAQRRGMI